MTIRSDVTIDWSLSPRIIEVAAPSTENTVQDLYDTCMFLESQTDAMDNLHIIDAAGKEELGGGTSVGLTVTLLNALLKFQDRAGPTWVLCNVSGGNLVALQADGVTYYESPIEPAAYVNTNTTASSSATTQSQEQLEYSTYQNGVTIDVINGVSGTDYPTGTPSQPVDNISDAQTICVERGFNVLYIRGNITLGATANLTDFILEGQNAQITTITVEAAANVSNTEFRNCRLTGTLDGGSLLRQGVAADVTYINGFLFQCMIEGTITLGGSQPAHIFDCYSGTPGLTTPTIDMGGSGQSLGLRGYNGGIKITNKNGSEDVSLDMNSGQIILDSTVTNGTIVCRGVADLIDNTGSPGPIINTEGLMATGSGLAEEVFNTDITSYTAANTFGQWINEKGLTVLKFMGLK